MLCSKWDFFREWWLNSSSHKVLSVFFCVLLKAYKPFYSEIVLKNNSSSQAQLFLPEPEASVARLLDYEAISVGDEASADEAAAKSDK